jgi:hypothetical protein
VLTIFTTFTSTTTPCGAAYNIWAFCLAVVVVIPVLGCLTSIVANLSAMPGLMAVPPVINLAMAMWGMYLWSQMGDKCMMALEAGYWDLVLLFKINVILLSISLFVFICILCLGAAFLGGAAATGGMGIGGGGGGNVGLLGRGDGESGMQEQGLARTSNCAPPPCSVTCPMSSGFYGKARRCRPQTPPMGGAPSTMPRRVGVKRWC